MKRQLITSALPYINGVKHLGNLVGSMLPADVFARYQRLTGHEVLFVCATDEHGTPAELAALAAGQEVEEFCREQHEIQRELGERFDLSWDHFGRSSSSENHELTHHFAAQLMRNGYLEERSVEQIWSPTDGRYLPDRYVIGTCPRCDYPKARGDQCENCGVQLDPVELKNPRSTISGATDLEVREEKHLFLKLSEFQDTLRTWIDASEQWPLLTTSTARKWLDEGLHDRCITRDLNWGVPVNVPGFEGKVYYVWFDAPIEYIGASAEWAAADPDAGRDWRSWWYAADDVTYTEFMAKDNIPFHTLNFPCTLIGSGEPWKLPDYIKGFNWLTYYGGKFSTTDQRGIFMNDALEILPSDYWRWYLMANAPEADDSSFTWELFAEAVNKDLAATLGNFVNRTLTFAERSFGSRVPSGGVPGERETALQQQVGLLIDLYAKALSEMRFRKATQHLRAVWAAGNKYLDEAAPWKSVKAEPDDAALALRTAINLIKVIATYSMPIIPATSATLLAVLGVPPRQDWSSDHGGLLTELEGGTPFTTPAILFDRVTEEQLAVWRDRFGAEG